MMTYCAAYRLDCPLEVDIRKGSWELQLISLLGEKIISREAIFINVKAVEGIIYSMEATCGQAGDDYTMVDVYIKVPGPASMFTFEQLHTFVGLRMLKGLGYINCIQPLNGSCKRTLISLEVTPDIYN